VVQVERLAVEVAAGLPDLEELLDLGVADVEVARAEPRRSEPWLIASVRLSITATNGMIPLVLPLSPTGSPIPRTLPQ
jgi:hypothetical protein